MKLEPPTKKLRSLVIAAHLAESGHVGVVCFTCGNAGRALEAVGLHVVAVGDHEDLRPGTWWTPGRIAWTWPHLFDATPGHLPMPLMVQLAQLLRDEVGTLDPALRYRVPTGSGETILCLRMAYPNVVFAPWHREDDPATRRDDQAPLMPAVHNRWEAPAC